MSNLFTYREFVQLTKKGKINYEKLTLPKNTLIGNSSEYSNNAVYLIVEGFVNISLIQSPPRVYTICGKGVFLNYYALLGTEMSLFSFKTASKCVIYKYYMRDLEYLLSMFPENYGFQFFIMKDLAAHLYYKTLLNSCIGNDKMETSFVNIAKLYGSPLESDKVSLPREIQMQTIFSYSGLSKSSGYKQLSGLKERGKLSKVNKQWIIHDQALHDFCQQRDSLQ
ncbi:Crp/Fnr family transcriptional regulator [Listeria monocytogenes]|nr:Crp/Fnr family transcriptional regulator [Listeria monocytogenes]